MFGVKTNAGANDLAFQQADINYLGSIATAMSLQAGQKETLVKNSSVNTCLLYTSVRVITIFLRFGRGRNFSGSEKYVFLPITTISVSYTHLDVYKRQSE